MSVKVVYNACYGGFSLSREASELLNKRKGRQVADPAFGFVNDISRHDSDLVSVVEELGIKAASGDCARLEIEEISGTLYRVTEYDGYESVETPDSTDWVSAL